MLRTQRYIGLLDNGRGTKYRLSMSERLRQARLHSDFLASEGAESAAAAKANLCTAAPESERKRTPSKGVWRNPQHVHVANT